MNSTGNNIKDKLHDRVAEVYDLAKDKNNNNLHVMRFYFSQFVTNLAMLWLLCDGNCETLKKEEVEELTYIFSYSKGISLLEDQWVQESLYQLHPEWNVKETFSLIYKDYNKRTNPLLNATKLASVGGSMPLPVTT